MNDPYDSCLVKSWHQKSAWIKSVPSPVLSYYGARLKGLYIQLILQGLNHVLYVGWQLLLKLAAGACTSKLPATL